MAASKNQIADEVPKARGTARRNNRAVDRLGGLTRAAVGVISRKVRQRRAVSCAHLDRLDPTQNSALEAEAANLRAIMRDQEQEHVAAAAGEIRPAIGEQIVLVAERRLSIAEPNPPLHTETPFTVAMTVFGSAEKISTCATVGDCRPFSPTLLRAMTDDASAGGALGARRHRCRRSAAQAAAKQKQRR